ncbi:TetR family transcriptional regulator [Kaistella anthropi]|nr:TetR family transcriptional regulator [Kaistella anthropi]
MQLFFTRGVDAVSIRDIAKAAECNSSMIHYYFRTKEKLLYFIVERTTADTVSIVDEEIKQKNLLNSSMLLSISFLTGLF